MPTNRRRIERLNNSEPQRKTSVKEGIIKALGIIFGGIGGSILTICYQMYFAKPQSFTFIYDGNKVVVTESSYLKLTEENKKLENENEVLDTQLKKMQQDMDEENKRQEYEKVKTNAEMYWNNSKYVEALKVLKDSNLKSNDIMILYKNYSEEYCTYVMQEADNLVTYRKYNEAKNILEEAKKLVSDSGELDTKIEEIRNKEPIKLSDLKIAALRYFNIKENGDIEEDTVGNKYSMTNLFKIRARGDEYGYATFYLGQQYTDLSGIISISDKSENRSDTQLDGRIELYLKNGEEYRQVYASSTLTRITSPIQIPEIDLKDADWLEIRYYNNEAYYTLASGYLSLEVLLSDFILYKD